MDTSGCAACHPVQITEVRHEERRERDWQWFLSAEYRVEASAWGSDIPLEPTGMQWRAAVYIRVTSSSSPQSRTPFIRTGLLVACCSRGLLYQNIEALYTPFPFLHSTDHHPKRPFIKFAFCSIIILRSSGSLSACNTSLLLTSSF